MPNDLFGKFRSEQLKCLLSIVYVKLIYLHLIARKSNSPYNYASEFLFFSKTPQKFVKKL